MEVEKIQKEVSFERIFNDEKIAIYEEEHRKYIKDKSEGYPRVLDNYINEYLCMRDNGTMDLEELTGDIATVVKYIESGLDENAKMLLHILALFQNWPDQNIIREILGTEIHALQYVGEFETLLKKNVIKEIPDLKSVQMLC